VVPVNVGGYAELAVTFGVPAAIVGMAGFGWILGRLERLPVRGAIVNSIRIIVVLVLMSAVVKGGFVYLAANWAAVAAMLAAVGLLVHLLFDRPDPRRFRSAPVVAAGNPTVIDVGTPPADRVEPEAAR
jgi:hypothetical protein